MEVQNQMRKELTKEDKTRLFKAYLIVCDEYLEQKGLISQTGDYTAEDMLRYYMPFALKLNTVLSIKDPLIELIKSKWFLVDFASVDKQVAKYVDAYVSEKKCNSTSYYMLSLFNLSSKLINNEQRTNVIKLVSVDKQFLSNYLFYRVIDKVLADYKYQKMTGDEMLQLGQGLPDYYARKARRVFLFEFKDVQLNNEIVKSGNYDTIIKAIEKAFVKSDKGRPKGVTQLVNDIEDHLQDIIGKGFESQPLTIYPILVYQHRYAHNV